LAPLYHHIQAVSLYYGCTIIFFLRDGERVWAKRFNTAKTAKKKLFMWSHGEEIEQVLSTVIISIFDF